MTSKQLTTVLLLGLLACSARSRGVVIAQEPPW